MKKGIIMEIKQDILVLMTPEGEFLTGRKQPDQQYAIGEEIPFFPVSLSTAKSKPIYKWNWRVSTSLLTVLVVIIALFSSTVLQNNRAYAYVSVDINPSMELTLNKDQQVLNIKPYNGDAKVLLKELSDWKNENVGEVTEKIFLLSEKLGYLKGIQKVFITSSFIDDSDPKRETELLDELNEFVEDYGTDHSTNIIMEETSREFREKASEKGMTAGSLIRETEQKDFDRTTEPVEKELNKEEKEVQEKEKQKKAIIDEKVKAAKQKVNPPVKEKKQNAEKTQRPQKNPDHPQKPQPEKRERGKPEKSQPGNSSNGNNGNRGNDKPNRGHDHSPRNDQGDHRNNDKHNDQQNRNEEKKHNHENRKENKKD